MDTMTPKVFCFTAHLEGLVQEAYKDSVGVWTWALGVTNASGHTVYPRYKDNPQTIYRCVEVSEWLMREQYLPAVLKAFSGYVLSEAELAAALSFHWNTGAIMTTSWVKMVKSGDMVGAEKFLRTHYLNGGTLQSRRNMEADLFFDNIWPDDLDVPVYKVSKPSYTPNWGSATMIDLLPYMEAMYKIKNACVNVTEVAPLSQNAIAEVMANPVQQEVSA